MLAPVLLVALAPACSRSDDTLAQAEAAQVSAPEKGAATAAVTAPAAPEKGAATAETAASAETAAVTAALAAQLRAVKGAASTQEASPTVGGAGKATGTTGPAVRGEGFEAFLRATGPIVVGKPAPVEVVLHASAPFKCNDKYPYKFALNAETGVPEGVFRDMKVHKKEGVLAVPFVPDRAGATEIAGTLSFSVCTDDKCLVDRAELKLPATIASN